MDPDFFFFAPLPFISSTRRSEGVVHYPQVLFSWDWRTSFWGKSTKWGPREGFQNTREPHAISYLFLTLSVFVFLFFFPFKARKDWVATVAISHASQIYLFMNFTRQNIHQVLGCWAAMRFSLPAITFFSRLTFFFFWFDTQFKAAKYYRLAEENGSRTLGNSWYVILSSYFPHSFSWRQFFSSFFFLPLPQYFVQGVP